MGFILFPSGSDPEPVLPEEGGLRAAPDPQPAVQEGAPHAVRGPGEHQRHRQLSQGRTLPLFVCSCIFSFLFTA